MELLLDSLVRTLVERQIGNTPEDGDGVLVDPVTKKMVSETQ